ncbi:MAG: DUF4936 family protein [Casimicrobiaceae bacterium]
MADCYVYYRIDAAREAEAKRALDAMLIALQAATGITGRIYCKTHEPLLWMEVYCAVADPETLVDTLSGLAEAHGLTACIALNQRRHVEQFTPLDGLSG